MRGAKGRLISIWMPGIHGAGGSTITLMVAIAMQHLTSKKVLILNMGCKGNYLEQYIKNDMDVRFSMDYLKSFGLGISAEHIKTYSSKVNDNLFILPNSNISNEINKVERCYYEQFIEKSLEAFDFVIVDLGTGLSREKELFLDKSDVMLAVLSGNVMMLKDIMDTDPIIRAYMQHDKVMPIVNGLHEGENDMMRLGRFNKYLGLRTSFGISYDLHIKEAACFEGRFYSFLKRELNKKRINYGIAGQAIELCKIITERLLIEIDSIQDGVSLVGMIFSKVRLRGELDA